MYSMLFGHLPFENDLKNEMKQKTQKDISISWTPNNVYHLYSFIRSKPLKIPKTLIISHEAKDLLNGMLDVCPRKRLSIHQILDHSWFIESTQN